MRHTQHASTHQASPDAPNTPANPPPGPKPLLPGSHTAETAPQARAESPRLARKDRRLGRSPKRRRTSVQTCGRFWTLLARSSLLVLWWVGAGLVSGCRCRLVWASASRWVFVGFGCARSSLAGVGFAHSLSAYSMQIALPRLPLSPVGRMRLGQGSVGDLGPSEPAVDSSEGLDAGRWQGSADPDCLRPRLLWVRRRAGFGWFDRPSTPLRPVATGGAGDSVAVISTPRAAGPSSGATQRWLL